MRLAWFSPLPPIPSGISDYSAELLPLVAERTKVDAVCPRPGRLRRVRVPAGRSWTDALGVKELSCYNGAVRLYWPGFTRKSKPLVEAGL